MKTGDSFLDRLIDRLDRLDPSSVQSYLLKLVREKGFLESLFNTIHEGIIVIDRNIRIYYLNAAARELLGIPEGAEGNRLDRHLRDVDWLALMEADPEEWHRISFTEIEVFYPEHRILSFYLVPHPADSGDSQIPFATIIFRDVTQLRQNTRQTVETQKIEAITKLAAGVAHEIGNPLNSLTIHLQLLQRCLHKSSDPDTAAEGAELVEVAIQEVARLDSIVHNFLRAVRPVPLQLQPVAMQKVLAETLKFMRWEIEDRNIRVEVAMPDKMPHIQADPDQLRQALFNIIKNSIQAIGNGGLLQIISSVQDDALELRIEDNGKGISSENLSRILDPYFTTRADGTGLGLLVVERILRNHGADFSIESGEGQGTAFIIRFPLRERQVRLLQAPPAADERPDSQPQDSEQDT
jgi:two-component system, sporulation sensor kinase E